MFDDRPIKPDKKYLQSEEEKWKKKQEMMNHKKIFLQKSHSLVLPCQKENVKCNAEKKKKCLKSGKKQSCAQKYEKIIKANKEKFGQWNLEKNKTVKKIEIKKIDPKHMTINYKPKEIKIDTRQYKKLGYVAEPILQIKKNEEKIEYNKMVDYMKKLYEEFEIDKQKFDEEKEYLKFKKNIQNLDGINLLPKYEIMNKEKNIKQIKGQKSNLHEKTANQIIDSSTKNQNQQNCQKMNVYQKQNDDVGNGYQHEQITKITQPKNSICKLFQCSPFNLISISNFVDKQQFTAQNCQLYMKTKQILERQRSTGLVQVIKAKCKPGSIGANHATCSEHQCAEKRITKFNANWFELWIAGTYRIMYNQDLGYKVVWYANGDIKQEFSGGRVKIYESKANKVVSVKVDNHLPFWYFPYLQQLETKDKQGNTEVVFMDGRHQIIQAEKGQQHNF